MDPADFGQALERAGFVGKSGKGDHVVYRHLDGRSTSIDTGKSQMSKVLLRDSLKDVKWSEDDLLVAIGRKKRKTPETESALEPILTISGEEFIVNPLPGYEHAQFLPDSSDVAARDGETVVLTDAFFDLGPEAREKALARTKTAHKYPFPAKDKALHDLLDEAGLDYPSDFVTADGLYRRWKAQYAGQRGPKPVWEGGEMDAVNHALELQGAARVSGPLEAFERLTNGVRAWTDSRLERALEVMREIPGLSDLRLPEHVREYQYDNEWKKQDEDDYMRAGDDYDPEHHYASVRVNSSIRVRANDPVKKVVDFHGIKVALEWLKGETRKYSNDFSRPMFADYGFVADSDSEDGEELDVYLGPDLDSDKVFIVAQLVGDWEVENGAEPGSFDEFKILFSVSDAGKAEALYKLHMPSECFGGLWELSIKEFKTSILPLLGLNESALNKSGSHSIRSSTKLTCDFRNRDVQLKKSETFNQVPFVPLGRSLPSAEERRANRTRRDAKLFGDLFEGGISGSHSQGFGKRPRQAGFNFVHSGVVGPQHELEIFDPVIQPVPIDMVNDLAPKQFASEMGFHNEAMFKSLTPNPINLHTNQPVWSLVQPIKVSNMPTSRRTSDFLRHNQSSYAGSVPKVPNLDSFKEDVLPMLGDVEPVRVTAADIGPDEELPDGPIVMIPASIMQGWETGLDRRPTGVEWAETQRPKFVHPVFAKVTNDGTVLFNNGHHRVKAQGILGQKVPCIIGENRLQPELWEALLDRLDKGFTLRQINPEGWNLNKRGIPSLAALEAGKQSGLKDYPLEEFYQNFPESGLKTASVRVTAATIVPPGEVIRHVLDEHMDELEEALKSSNAAYERLKISDPEGAMYQNPWTLAETLTRLFRPLVHRFGGGTGLLVDFDSRPESARRQYIMTCAAGRTRDGGSMVKLRLAREMIRNPSFDTRAFSHELMETLGHELIHIEQMNRQQLRRQDSSSDLGGYVSSSDETAYLSSPQEANAKAWNVLRDMLDHGYVHPKDILSGELPRSVWGSDAWNLYKEKATPEAQKRVLRRMTDMFAEVSKRAQEHHKYWTEWWSHKNYDATDAEQKEAEDKFWADYWRRLGIEKTAGVRVTAAVPRKPRKKKAPTSQGTLVAVHNLSSSNLMHASKQGLIAPSIAITKSNLPFDSFGEITLVAPLHMVDPAKEPVFDADIYSPRYPNVRYKPDYKAIDKIKKGLADQIERTQSYWSDYENSVESDGPESITRERKPALQLAFLEKVKGLEIPTPTRNKPVELEWVDAAPSHQFFQENGYDRNSRHGDEYWQGLSAAAQASIQEYFNSREGLDDEDKQYLIDEAVKRHFDEGQLDYGTLDRVLRAHQSIGKTETDKHTFQEQLDELVKPYQAEFDAWAKEQLKGSVAGRYLTTEGGKKIPYTLDNVLKLMTKKTKGGEGYNYGLGSLRALGANRFKSLESMEQAKDKLVSKEEFEKVKKSMEERFFALVEDLEAYKPHGSNEFRRSDALMSSLGESFKRGRSLWQELKKDGYEGVPSGIIQELQQFKQDLVAMPTEYFEAKPQRVVDLGEFIGAVVPSDASADVLQTLKDYGLKTIMYDKTRPETRISALESLAGIAKTAAVRRALVGSVRVTSEDIPEKSLEDVIKFEKTKKKKTPQGEEVDIAGVPVTAEKRREPEEPEETFTIGPDGIELE